MNNIFVKCQLLQEWLGTPESQIVYLSKFKAAEMSSRGICKVYEEDQKNESPVDLEKVNEENNPQGEETLVSETISKPLENKSLDNPVKDKMVKGPKIKK